MNTMRFSEAFAAPILWGVRAQYSLAEIAAGLEIDEALVHAVIAERTGISFPRLLDVPARIDPTRNDPAYRAWRMARF